MGESGRTERREATEAYPDVCRHMCPVPQPVRSFWSASTWLALGHIGCYT